MQLQITLDEQTETNTILLSKEFRVALFERDTWCVSFQLQVWMIPGSRKGKAFLFK